MHKSKGQWIVLSSSILASVVALNLAAPVAFAQDVADEVDAPDVTETADQNLETDVTALVAPTEIAPVVSEADIAEAAEVSDLVDSIVDDVVAQDELAAEESLVALLKESINILVENKFNLTLLMSAKCF